MEVWGDLHKACEIWVTKQIPQEGIKNKSIFQSMENCSIGYGVFMGCSNIYKNGLWWDLGQVNVGVAGGSYSGIVIFALAEKLVVMV